MDSEDDIHDRLTKAYLDYFKSYMWWEKNKSVRAYYSVQRCLRTIKDLADKRNDEMRREFRSKNPKTENKNLTSSTE